MKRVRRTPRLAAPPKGATKAPRQRPLAKARHRAHRVTVTVMFVLALGFTLFMSTGTSQEATAVTNKAAAPALPDPTDSCNFLPNGNQNWEPSEPGSGGDGFMYPSEYMSEDTAKTPLEKYGMRGMTWSMTSYTGKLDDVADDEQDCNFMPTIHNMIGQETLTASQSVASITITVRQKATDASPFMRMLRDATPTTDDALKKWFIPAAGLMVLVTGIWMALQAGTGSRRNIIAGLAWVVMSIFVVGWLMMPTDLANGRAGADCKGDKECELAYSGGTTGTDGVPEGETPIYADDPNYYALTAKANDTGNDLATLGTSTFAPRVTSEECSVVEGEKDEGTRTLDCILWYEMAFRPWSVGQFGSLGENPIPWTEPSDRNNDDPPKEVTEGAKASAGATRNSKKYANDEKPEEGDDVRMIMLSAQTFSWQESAASGNARDTNGIISSGGKYTGSPNRVTTDADKDDHEIWDITSKNGLWNQVRAYMAGEQPRDYDTWSGMERTSDRTSTAFLALIGNLLIAAFVLVTSLLTLMWYAVVVIALMALPIVGLISIFPPAQKLLRALGQLWMKGLILAVVFTILQIGVASITGAVMASNAAFGWKVVLLFAAVLGLFKVARLAREDAFTPNLNSQGVAESADPQQAVNKVSPVVAGAGFAAGRGATRVAGRGAKATGRAAGNKAKSAGVKVNKGVDKATTKGKEAAHKGAVKARESDLGQRVGGKTDDMQGWAAKRKRDKDFEKSKKRAEKSDGYRGDRAARRWSEREEARDQRDQTRAERKQAREKEAEDLRQPKRAKKQKTAEARHRLSSGGERNYEVEAEAPPTQDAQPKVTKVTTKRSKNPRNGDTDSAPDSGRQQPTDSRSNNQPKSGDRPGAQPKDGRTNSQPTGNDQPGGQPKVQRPRNRRGTRLDEAEEKRLAEKVGRTVQEKVDSKAPSKGDGRVK